MLSTRKSSSSVAFAGFRPFRIAGIFPVRAFIFDMDGTLADTMPYHQLAWDAMIPELGVQPDRDEFFHWSAGLTNREIFPRLLGREVSAEELGALSERKEALYRELYRPHLDVLPGVNSFLRRTIDAGYPRAVGSAAPPDNLDLVLDGLSLRHCFQAIVGGADVARGKPDPEIFLRAAGLLGVAPQACVVFEDAPAGIEAARRAGMSCVVVSTTLNREQVYALGRDSAHVTHIIDDFTDPSLDSLFG
jgi:beta-phosphoglucomutase